ncbi:RICIN domain-containing protein [Streptomyces sp. NPDC089799]|uniref:RICIN domain-containing protein n=1 Tax=Streptomyces sp. NPDC089799 TaxID=3155066 RepID=UPI003431238B
MFALEGTAHAVGIGDPINAVEADKLKLRDEDDVRVDVRTGVAANEKLTPATLADALNATGRKGKNGLCYPEPFHPGLDARGYCWDDPEDDSGVVDEKQPNWMPQGFSVPHTSTQDGTYPASTTNRWEVVSMYDKLTSDTKLRFVHRGTSATNPDQATYFDVLLTRVNAQGQVTPVDSHADGIVWYEKNLLLSTGGSLQVYSLDNLLESDDPGSAGYQYIMPMTLFYLSYEKSAGKCDPGSVSPCLNSLSFDRTRKALVSGEFTQSIEANAPRIVQWPFNLETWLPRADDGSEFGETTATAAWQNTLIRTQGVTRMGADFFISAACPAGYDNGYIESSCVYKTAPGGHPAVLTAVPDMTQNIDWDSSTGRLRGVNEVIRNPTVKHNQRLVFDFAPEARPVNTFRLKNVTSGKCLLPYAAGLDNNATVIQFTCSGTNSQDWYWEGSKIRNFQSKRCLSVKDASSSNGALLVQYDCNNHATQDWTVQPGKAGGAILQNRGNGLCAVPSAGNTDNSAPVVQWVCNPSHPAHAWIGTSK